MVYDVVVVGGGIAGLTASAYIARAGKSVLLLEKQHKVGGHVGSFEQNGFIFDHGIRSIESSGIVFPMIRQLELPVEFVHSAVSLGITDRMISVESKASLEDYSRLLKDLYPESSADIDAILREIVKIMQHMDILYGIDNPLFLDSFSDLKYVIGTLLPWAFRYLLSMPRVAKLDKPVDEYLHKFTDNQMLIDIIAQHFFKKTPTFFALSYFTLYLDYNYPKGGTGAFPQALRKYVEKHGGEIKTNTSIGKIDAQGRTVTDLDGNSYGYRKLIWAADMKALYNGMDLDALTTQDFRNRIVQKQEELAPKEGGDSIFTLYMAVDLPPSYFSQKSNPHLFYTPRKEGLSQAQLRSMDKGDLFDWLRANFQFNTFEVSIPVLRDPSLAPEGKTGLIVSTLFDYALAAYLEEMGWYEEFKQFSEGLIIEILSESLYPELPGHIIEQFSSTPITIERRTGNSGGAITGWAFTNEPIPAVHEMKQITKSVQTIVPDIYQAGQWTFSPSGLPISVLTGKLAADAAIKSINS